MEDITNDGDRVILDSDHPLPAFWREKSAEITTDYGYEVWNLTLDPPSPAWIVLPTLVYSNHPLQLIGMRQDGDDNWDRIRVGLFGDAPSDTTTMTFRLYEVPPVIRYSAGDNVFGMELYNSEGDTVFSSEAVSETPITFQTGSVTLQQYNSSETVYFDPVDEPPGVYCAMPIRNIVDRDTDPNWEYTARPRMGKFLKDGNEQYNRLIFDTGNIVQHSQVTIWPEITFPITFQYWLFHHVSTAY